MRGDVFEMGGGVLIPPQTMSVAEDRGFSSTSICSFKFDRSTFKIKQIMLLQRRCYHNGGI